MINDANKTSHIDIVQNPDVADFLKGCTYMREPTNDEIEKITKDFINYSGSNFEDLPANIITIDSSSYESKIREDIPFTNIGYVKLVVSLLKNREYMGLKGNKFVNPFEVSKIVDEHESITFVLPSSNIKYKDTNTTRNGFRLALDECFENIREDKNDRNTSLKSTLFWLSSFRNDGARDRIILHKCPNEKCQRKNLEVFNIKEDQYCPSCGEKIFAVDTLRLHEEIDEFAPTNVGVLGRFEKLIRHIYLAHLLRILVIKNRSNYLSVLNELAIIVNGPLSIAGTAAWVHGSLMKVINSINLKLRAKNLSDLLVIGMINGGLAISDYAQLISKHLNNNSFLCVSDEFRNKYINFNREASSTTFGAETYYGQDFILKNKFGDMMVFNIPYPQRDKSNLEIFIKEKSDYKKYSGLNRTVNLLQELKCDINRSTITPLVISKQYTAISMQPGAKVLDMLSRNGIT